MNHYEPSSFPSRPRESHYVFNHFVGGLIRHSVLLVLILWFGFAAATAAVGTAKSFWYHNGARGLVAALESKLAAFNSSARDLKTESQPQARDMVRVQREENWARRKLANELRQR